MDIGLYFLILGHILEVFSPSKNSSNHACDLIVEAKFGKNKVGYLNCSSGRENGTRKIKLHFKIQVIWSMTRALTTKCEGLSSLMATSAYEG